MTIGENCKLQFEDWAHGKGMVLDTAFFADEENNYVNPDTHLAYEIWLASRSNRLPEPPVDPNTKVPRLFYYEEAENAWCPVPVDILILDPAEMGEGEEYDLRFKRADMTEAEFEALPEG